MSQKPRSFYDRALVRTGRSQRRRGVKKTSKHSIAAKLLEQRTISLSVRDLVVHLLNNILQYRISDISVRNGELDGKMRIHARAPVLVGDGQVQRVNNRRSRTLGTSATVAILISCA